jgi:release factor glutamine methyltransferase
LSSIKFQDPNINNNFTDVYSPSDDSYLILDFLKKAITNYKFDDIPIQEVKQILDMGTGTGIVAIFLEMVKSQIPSFQGKVYASDILPNAINCAKINEKLNKVNNRITFIQSNLFESFSSNLSHSFDIIIFNPPYLPSIENSSNHNYDFTWNGGDTGLEIMMRFFKNAKSFLSNDGVIYFICSSNTPIKSFFTKLTSKNYFVEEVDKLHFFFEDIILNKARVKT